MRGNEAMTTIYEIWKPIDETTGAMPVLVDQGNFARVGHALDGKYELLKSFEAETYDQAAQIFYDCFGWGKYHPM